MGGIVLFLSYCFLFYFISLHFIQRPRSLRKIISDTLIICLPATLYFYHEWLLTPSYNWLCLFALSFFVGAIAASTYILNTQRKNLNVTIVLLAFLSSCFAILIFAGKPSTAFLVAVTYPVTAYFFKNKIIWLKFSSALTVFSVLLLALHIYMFFGSLSIYAESLTNGIDYGATLGAGHTFSSRFGDLFNSFLYFPVYTGYYFTLSCALISIILIIQVYPSKTKKIRWLSNFCLRVLPFILISEFIYLHFRGFHGPVIIPFATLLLVYWVLNNSEYKSSEFIKFLFSIAVFCFAALMFSLAFGFASASGALAAGNSAAILASIGMYIFGNLNISKSTDIEANTPLLILNLSLVAAFLIGTFNPYRLHESIFKQEYPISTLEPKINLIVDAPTYHYLTKLKDLSDRYNWESGDHLIDLTGASPGATLFLAGTFLSKPWILGGAKGSITYANKVLVSASDYSEGNIWFLTSIDGPRTIKIDKLNTEKFNFPEQYELVGSLYYPRRNETQYLWRPSQN